MNALSKQTVALAMASIAAQQSQPQSPFLGLNPRDTKTAKDFEQACADLAVRKKQLDDLITRYQDGIKKLDDLPDNIKNDLEARSNDIKKLSGEIEDLQQKLVDGVQQRGANPDSVAGILIRNKNIVDQAQAITRAKGKFQFDDLHRFLCDTDICHAICRFRFICCSGIYHADFYWRLGALYFERALKYAKNHWTAVRDIGLSRHSMAAAAPDAFEFSLNWPRLFDSVRIFLGHDDGLRQKEFCSL